MINEIKYIQEAQDNGVEMAKIGKWTRCLEKQEVDRKEARVTAQKHIRDDAERLKKEKVQANLEKRMLAKSKKIGKQDMFRSKKPDKKKKEEKKVVDEDTQDQQKYLGEDLKTMEERAKMELQMPGKV